MKLILDRLVQSESLLTSKNDVEMLERSLQLESKRQVPIDMFLHFQPA
jgi:hypothetical protein